MMGTKKYVFFKIFKRIQPAESHHTALCDEAPCKSEVWHLNPRQRWQLASLVQSQMMVHVWLPQSVWGTHRPTLCVKGILLIKSSRNKANTISQCKQRENSHISGNYNQNIHVIKQGYGITWLVLIFLDKENTWFRNEQMSEKFYGHPAHH